MNKQNKQRSHLTTFAMGTFCGMLFCLLATIAMMNEWIDVGFWLALLGG